MEGGEIAALEDFIPGRVDDAVVDGLGLTLNFSQGDNLSE